MNESQIITVKSNDRSFTNYEWFKRNIRVAQKILITDSNLHDMLETAIIPDDQKQSELNQKINTFISTYIDEVNANQFTTVIIYHYKLLF